MGAVVGICAGAAQSRTTMLFESECSGRAVTRPMPDEDCLLREAGKASFVYRENFR